jgi:hypothetical protein
MNLRDLHKHSFFSDERRQLWDLLNKLNTIVQDKFDKDYFACEYFEKFGCEIKRSDIPFKGDIDHIPLEVRIDTIDHRNFKYHINMPVEVAEKILVLGLP